MNKILKDMRKEFRSSADAGYKKGAVNYFKEKIKIYGVRTPVRKRISAKYFKEIKHLSKKEVFSLCEELLRTNYGEEANTAFDWVFRMKDQYENKDFKIFEKWLKTYVTDWAMCDNFCAHALGCFIDKFPEFIPEVKKWTKSGNRWVKRGSAVLFIYPVAKRGKYLKHVFEIADALLLDTDYMVQKGYGWMLKVAADVYRKKVFDYVVRNKHKMPRLALRYAIEKMPVALKKKAMEK